MSLTVRFWRIVFANYDYDETQALKILADSWRRTWRLTRKEGEA